MKSMTPWFAAPAARAALIIVWWLSSNSNSCVNLTIGVASSNSNSCVNLSTNTCIKCAEATAGNAAPIRPAPPMHQIVVAWSVIGTTYRLRPQSEIKIKGVARRRPMWTGQGGDRHFSIDWRNIGQVEVMRCRNMPLILIDSCMVNVRRSIIRPHKPVHVRVIYHEQRTGDEIEEGTVDCGTFQGTPPFAMDRHLPDVYGCGVD